MKIVFTKEEKQRMLDNLRIDDRALCNCVNCKNTTCSICPITAISKLSIFDVPELIKNLEEE